MSTRTTPQLFESAREATSTLRNAARLGQVIELRERDPLVLAIHAALDGAECDLEDERMKVAACSTAALGYWKEGDPLHPDYECAAIHDVAKLYARMVDREEDWSAITTLLGKISEADFNEIDAAIKAQRTRIENQQVIIETQSTFIKAAEAERDHARSNRDLLIDFLRRCVVTCPRCESCAQTATELLRDQGASGSRWRIRSGRTGQELHALLEAIAACVEPK